MRFLLALSLSLICAAAQAQPTRVRGTISAFDGKILSVRDADGAPVRIQVGGKTEIVFTQPITLAEIRQGDFLGVTSMRRADGRDDQTMTNAVGAPVNLTHDPSGVALRIQVGPKR
jgi:hypothetical protein